jgi:hypothetical protein
MDNITPEGVITRNRFFIEDAASVGTSREMNFICPLRVSAESPAKDVNGANEH